MQKNSLYHTLRGLPPCSTCHLALNSASCTGTIIWAALRRNCALPPAQKVAAVAPGCAHPTEGQMRMNASKAGHDGHILPVTTLYVIVREDATCASKAHSSGRRRAHERRIFHRAPLEDQISAPSWRCAIPYAG